MRKERLIIAIDGPAGSGKTTVSKIVAKKLGIINVDTGAMYRAITYELLKKKVCLDNIEEIRKNIDKIRLKFKLKNKELVILTNGRNISKKIRSEFVSSKVNIVSQIPEVRQKLRKIQRSIGLKYDCVIEGRDITTVVFPDTKYKFYLDAPVTERALRRYKELKQLGEKVTFQEVKKALYYRDKLDKTRGINPLKIADDAVVINTKNLTPNKVAEKIVSYVKNLKEKLQN